MGSFVVGNFWPSLGKVNLTVFAWQWGADTLVPWQGGSLRSSPDAHRQQARTPTNSRQGHPRAAGRWRVGTGVFKAAGGLGEPEQTGEGREVGARPARSLAGDRRGVDGARRRSRML